MTTNSNTIASRLARLELEHFVGREPQKRILDEAIASPGRPWQILNLWGPTGVGKSTLIDLCQHEAEEAGRAFFRVNGHRIENRPQRFLDALADRLGLAPEEATASHCIARLNRHCEEGATTLVLDHHNRPGEFNRWLREEFLPLLDPRLLIIVASRQPLAQWWGGTATWQRLISPLPLHHFTLEETRRYLHSHGIEEPQLVEHAWRYSKGLPLALALIAAVVEHEGEEAITQLRQRQDITDRLVAYWQEEAREEGLETILERAAVVRCFNLDLLRQLDEAPVEEALFERLTQASFVDAEAHGWSLQELVRETLVHHLKNRSPERYAAMRARAIHYYAHRATGPGREEQRCQALQELFYMLGDGLVRAALYDQQPLEHDSFHLEAATPADFSDLEEYMAHWEAQRPALGTTKIRLFDRDRQIVSTQWITKEPCEPSLLDLTELIIRLPGSVTLLRDGHNRLRGLTIVFPIDETTRPYLAHLPVVRGYLRHHEEGEKEEGGHWFIRLIDVRDEQDQVARAALFRALTALLIQPARFVTSTPLPFYQSLLTRFGFEQANLPPHTDFGANRSAPYFVLDLRGERFTRYIEAMVAQQTGDSSLQALTPALARALADHTRQHLKEQSGQARTEMLDPLTPREREVALGAVEGLANCAIAAKLDVSEVTVKKHMSRIFEKLGVRNRRELIKQYWCH